MGDPFLQLLHTVLEGQDPSDAFDVDPLIGKLPDP
jgi:hypothetical protein